MMQLEDSIITTTYGDGIYIPKPYQGQYGLVAVRRGNNDVIYEQWVYLSKWSQAERGPVPDTKKRPMAVRLGKDPIAVLKGLIAEFEKGG